MSSDAWPAYEWMVEQVWGAGVDFATITKEYESEPVGRGRYAPPRVAGTTKTVRQGSPDEGRICTSIVERSNLTVRTMQRRFTRLVVVSKHVVQPS